MACRLLTDHTNATQYHKHRKESILIRRRLSLYPSGNKKSNGDKHISLYLMMAETNNLPLGWEVNAFFTFFVYDQIRDKYLTIQEVFIIKCEGKGERLSIMKEPEGICTWKIEKFSGLKEQVLYSRVFVIGERQWKLMLYPQGNSREKGKIGPTLPTCPTPCTPHNPTLDRPRYPMGPDAWHDIG
ncbi:hypothetical protein L1049_012560 [Liquidambar formosana]|uniref:MATH domain-containing protein n=1 Tax=Liquidambar formosana TaxID=63359 RepID=A0AAP0R2U4_LIQFO